MSLELFILANFLVLSGFVFAGSLPFTKCLFADSLISSVFLFFVD